MISHTYLILPVIDKYWEHYSSIIAVFISHRWPGQDLYYDIGTRKNIKYTSTAILVSSLGSPMFLIWKCMSMFNIESLGIPGMRLHSFYQYRHQLTCMMDSKMLFIMTYSRRTFWLTLSVAVRMIKSKRRDRFFILTKIIFRATRNQK